MFKHLAIFFCFLAFAGLQVHNIVPHYHTETQQLVDHKHHHHTDNDHGSPVSGKYHDVEFGKSIVKPVDLKPVIEKPFFLDNYFIVLFDKLAACSDVQPERIPGYNSALYVICLAHDIPLRAPPVFS